MSVLPPTHDILLEQFGQAAFNFLDAAIGVWPQDAVLKDAHAAWTAANATPQSAKEYTRAAMDGLKAGLGSLFSRFLKRDAAVWAEPNELLQRVDAAGKWAGATDDIRDTVWEYVKNVVQAASVTDVYSKCPQQVLDVVSSLANDIVGGVESGAMDMARINPMDITQRLMQTLKPEDVMAWGQQMTSEGSLDGLLAMVSTMLPQGAGVDVSALQTMMAGLGGGGMDVGALLGQLGGAGAGGGLDLGALMGQLSGAGAGGGGGGGLDIGALMGQLSGGAAPDLSALFGSATTKPKGKKH